MHEYPYRPCAIRQQTGDNTMSGEARAATSHTLEFGRPTTNKLRPVDLVLQLRRRKMARQPQTQGSDLRDDPQLQPFVLPNVRLTGRTIGGGSYGTVEELEVNGLLCAGKKLHEILVRRDFQGVRRVLGKFVEECSLLASLRHPHIVQFLGICFLETSDLPVLVMEYLPYCLDSLLEGPDRVDIPLALKYTILCDVARGLLHLHSCTPPIIHRDLTAKNVLLTAAMTAKLADLGVARILNEQPGRMAITMTQTPGTLAYMPPEVLSKNPKYNSTIDMFSFGHLALFTLVQDFPYPTPQAEMDPDNPGMLVARTEVQRRSEQMDQLSRQLGGTHPAVQLVTQCLHNDHRQRPLARQVLTQLEEMKATVQDPYADLSKLELIQALGRKEGGGREGSLQAQVTQLQDQLRTKEVELEARMTEAERLQDQLRTKDLQLESSVSEIEHVQGQLRSREQEIQELRAQLRRRDAEATEITRTPHQPAQAHRTLQSLNWRKGRDMLFAIRWPQVVAVDRLVYTSGSTAGGDNSFIVQVYTPVADRWSRLPKCPVKRFALAVLNCQLVAVGGVDSSGKPQSTLLVFNITSRLWTKAYPNMPTARAASVATSYQQFLVVAGGSPSGNEHMLNTVEILNSSTKQWYAASPLPEECRDLTAAVVGDILYLVGGVLQDFSSSKHMFSTSLPTLISHATSASRDTPPTWEDIATEQSDSAAVSINDSLLAVGGCDSNFMLSSDVHLYNPHNRQWSKVGHIPTPVQQCACTVLPSDEFMMVGGERETFGGISREMYIATVK